jgi:L-lactate dehydrogenase complex protein LldG
MTTQPAREAILARLKVSLADAPGVPEVPREYRVRLPEGVDIVTLFAERVADYRAEVVIVPSEGVGAAVGAIVSSVGPRFVVPGGFPDEWLPGSGLETVRDDPPLSSADLDAADGVITGCAVAIAETGTIVLDGGAGQGRRALSLVPDHHVCVVRADQVVGDVPEGVAAVDPRRPQTWISGPSATSDIELDRVEGVHGPRHLHVVIVAG